MCTLLWLSIIFYGLLYYLYIPAIAHIKPVHLQYDMSCFREMLCHKSFPFDNITLIENEIEFLRGGQGYALELILEMPESERNWLQGIFMIKLDMINNEGQLLKSTSRSAILRYRSPLFKIMYTLFFIPGLLAGSFEEKQSLVIPLFENYIEDSYNSTYFAHIEIQAQEIEVYSSSLRIHAQFTGLRYLMYYWPILSAVIGIGGNFLFLVITISLIWFYESTKTPNRHENTKQSQGFIRLQTRNNRSNVSIITERKEAEIENTAAFQDLPSDIDVQVERDITGIDREDINIETLPRHRGFSDLRDDDD